MENLRCTRLPMFWILLLAMACDSTQDSSSSANADSPMDAQALDLDATFDHPGGPDGGMALDVSSEQDLALPAADGAIETDAVTPPDAEMTDAAPMSPDWAWTWGDCRVAHRASRLAGDDKARCDARYLRPPPAIRFGLHWIFLGHSQEVVDTYPESQLQDANHVYAPSDMSLVNTSRILINDPVVMEGGRGTTRYTLRQLVPDLKQHLGLELDDPQAVLDAFIERQEAVGVASAREGLGRQLPTLDTRWTSATFYKHMARLHPTLITVVVRDARGEKSTGSFPSRNFSGATADVIFLTEPSALSALPHELGHFFGLVHTHGVWNRQPGATQAWLMTQLNGVDDADWANLQAFVGQQYDSDLADIYLPYDAEEQTLLNFENAQIFARKVLGWGEFTYTDDFSTVASDAAFIELIRDEAPPFMKNFVRSNESGSFTGNNCGKSYVGEDRRTLRCTYGDGEDAPLHLFTSAHPLLSTSLLFGDSTESNLMSYISTDISDGVRRKIHLTERQRQLLRFGVAMPSRQRLRNYALD
jgi:hypothetical protein